MIGIVVEIKIIEFLFCFYNYIISPGRHVKAAVQAKTGASDSDPAGDGDGGAEVPRHGRCVTLLLYMHLPFNMHFI